MKPRNTYIKCPLCNEQLIYEAEICKSCADWGKKNGVDLLERLREEQNIAHRYSSVLNRLAKE